MAERVESDSILREYDAARRDLETFAKKLEVLVGDILRESSLPVHSVATRVKDRASLERKLGKPNTHYVQLRDVTDVVGIRIICYFDDDVDRVAALVEREFDVDTGNTTDKRRALDPDRFGYLSLHHVVTIKEARGSLTDWKRYAARPAEIQTRSILQHAWAEIEHDLGYKARSEVPVHVRRRFSRVAGLLELADQEFRGIRDELRQYEEAVPQQIVSAPSDVLLDRASVYAFIEHEETVMRLDQKIAGISKSKLRDEIDPDVPMRRLLRVGVTNIADLRSELLERHELLLSFVHAFLGNRDRSEGTFLRGISLYYLAMVIALGSRDEALIKEFFGEGPQMDAAVAFIKNVYEAAEKSGA